MASADGLWPLGPEAVQDALNQYALDAKDAVLDRLQAAIPSENNLPTDDPDGLWRRRHGQLQNLLGSNAQTGQDT